MHFEAGHFWLVRVSDTSIIALSDRDAHPSFARDECPIQWREDIKFQGRTGVFRGKCSGSNFDLNGANLSGPSPRGMDRYSVSVEDDTIFVDTSQAWCRAWNDAPLAAPQCVIVD
jgi:nitrite reductase/ring-hydroxylating ferredoxin subunit